MPSFFHRCVPYIMSSFLSLTHHSSLSGLLTFSKVPGLGVEIPGPPTCCFLPPRSEFPHLQTEDEGISISLSCASSGIPIFPLLSYSSFYLFSLFAFLISFSSPTFLIILSHLFLLTSLHLCLIFVSHLSSYSSERGEGFSGMGAPGVGKGY